MLMLVNRETGKGLGVTLFESEEAMRRGDEALNAMNPGAQRASHRRSSSSRCRCTPSTERLSIGDIGTIARPLTRDEECDPEHADGGQRQHCGGAGSASVVASCERRPMKTLLSSPCAWRVDGENEKTVRRR